MKNFLTNTIDIFYPPFRRFVTLQTFRYAACGGGNTILGLLIFYVCFYFIFKQTYYDAGFYVFEPHSAALIISSTVCFLVGFMLNKFVVFTSSHLRGRVQLFRYLLSFLFNLVVNYFMLKLFIESWHWQPMLSQVVTISFIIVLSYVSQKHFTFHTHKPGEKIDSFN